MVCILVDLNGEVQNAFLEIQTGPYPEGEDPDRHHTCNRRYRVMQLSKLCTQLHNRFSSENHHNRWMHYIGKLTAAVGTEPSAVDYDEGRIHFNQTLSCSDELAISMCSPILTSVERKTSYYEKGDGWDGAMEKKGVYMETLYQAKFTEVVVPEQAVADACAPFDESMCPTVHQTQIYKLGARADAAHARRRRANEPCFLNSVGDNVLMDRVLRDRIDFRCTDVVCAAYTQCVVSKNTVLNSKHPVVTTTLMMPCSFLCTIALKLSGGTLTLRGQARTSSMYYHTNGRSEGRSYPGHDWQNSDWRWLRYSSYVNDGSELMELLRQCPGIKIVAPAKVVWIQMTFQHNRMRPTIMPAVAHVEFDEDEDDIVG